MSSGPAGPAAAFPAAPARASRVPLRGSRVRRRDRACRERPLVDVAGPQNRTAHRGRPARPARSADPLGREAGLDRHRFQGLGPHRRLPLVPRGVGCRAERGGRPLAALHVAHPGGRNRSRGPGCRCAAPPRHGGPEDVRRWRRRTRVGRVARRPSIVRVIHARGRCAGTPGKQGLLRSAGPGAWRVASAGFGTVPLRDQGTG